MFFGMRKVLQDLDLNLLKLELFKDKTLVSISVLQHIHHENRPISSAFKARRK